MKKLTAILLGKIIHKALRLLKKGGGSAAPGLYALKLYPNLVENLVKKIPTNIIITGTNGKTTTAKILAHFATACGLKVIFNSTGSNLERGIASTLISHSNVLGKLNYNLGIWEIDEAAFNTIAVKINPDAIVFLNVFRDQLDRYGEVDTVIKKWTATLKQINKKTTVLINGDDQNLYQLQEGFSGKIDSFGIEGDKIKGEYNHQKDKPQKLTYQAQKIHTDGLKGVYFQLLNTGFYLPIAGVYQVYNAVASLICAYKLQLPLNQLSKSLKDFSPAFGRVEKIRLNSSNGYIFLIKNPIGATQVFNTLAPQLKKDDRLLIALNDNLADGTDVSWIWDANFEVLQSSSRAKPRDYIIYTSGTRANDLALRLKYAGFESSQITIEVDLERAFKRSTEGLKSLPNRHGTLYILPTYTAMLQLQQILTKSGAKKHYWEEN